VVSWILKRLKRPEKPVTQNKQYAAEVLAILLQSSSVNRKVVIDLNGVDLFLQLLSVYRKRDPEKGTDEEEFGENIFDCLTCLVEVAEGKAKFVEAEGVELCLIMIKEGMMSRARALRLLDHSLAGSYGGEVAEKVVDAAGLKPIFSMFMKKVCTTEQSIATCADALNSRIIKPWNIFWESSRLSYVFCRQILRRG
jgi:beta-catenin-like protein 1